jgi:hypothetical protein
MHSNTTTTWPQSSSHGLSATAVNMLRETEMTWSTLFLAVALILALYSVVTKTQRPKSNLSHIPVLGAEMSAKARREAFTWNAKEFLARGYREV